MKRATLRELKQDEATAKREFNKLYQLHGNYVMEAIVTAKLVVEAQAMLRNISQAIKRREKEKRT